MDIYTVELRIEAEQLSPQQVSDALQLEPSLVRRAGQARGARSTYSKSLWAFSGAQSQREWHSIEDGLRHLLDALLPVRPQLEPFFRECSVYWWCAKFQSSFDGTLVLSPATLRSLGELGAPLMLTSYFGE